MLSLIPHSADNPAYRDGTSHQLLTCTMLMVAVLNIQGEMQRQAEMVRSFDEPPEPPFSASRPYFSGLSIDNPPVSPRQVPQDARTPTLSVPRQNFYRPPVPSHLSITPRRYGSIGSNLGTSPNSLRPQVPPPPPMPHPLASVSSPPANIPRRHTSADIRNVQGWQANPSPFGSGNRLKTSALLKVSST